MSAASNAQKLNVPAGPSGPCGLTSLEDCTKLPDFPYPSIASLRWALNKHRCQFAAAGALVVIRGRIFIDVPRFESAVVEIGRAVAMRALIQKEGV